MSLSTGFALVLLLGDIVFAEWVIFSDRLMGKHDSIWFYALLLAVLAGVAIGYLAAGEFLNV